MPSLANHAGWTSVQESLAHLRAIGERFTEFMASQLDELEARRMELTARERELFQQRNRCDDLESRQAEQLQELQRQESRFAALLDERDQARRELESVRKELSLVQESSRTERERADQQAAELARQQMAWRELAAEFDHFRAAADSANQQATARAEQHAQTLLAERESRQQAERELMAARSQHQKANDDAQALLAAREQLTTLGRELSEARSAVAAAAAERQALTARHEQIHERLMAELAKALEQLARAQSAACNENHAELQEYLTRIAQLEGERDELAAELDAVIGRAADAVESAARDRRQAAEERGAWESEINTLRQALAGHAAPAANGRAIVARRLPIGGAPMAKPGPTPVSRKAPAAAKGAAAPSATDPSSDPLLDSVMAQFALLKKNAVRPPARQKVNP